MSRFIFAIAALLIGTTQVTQAQESSGFGGFELNNHQLISLATQDVGTLGLNWKVGDKMNYSVSLASMGNIGTSEKSVTKDEGTSLWMVQTIDIPMAGQKQTTEIQLEKATGKVLKLIVNGKEQDLSNDDQGLEIISQDYTSITVAAGTYKALHIVAKTKDVSKIEVWMNPKDTCIDGTLKQVMAIQFGDLALELTSFKRN